MTHINSHSQHRFDETLEIVTHLCDSLDEFLSSLGHPINGRLCRERGSQGFEDGEEVACLVRTPG